VDRFQPSLGNAYFNQLSYRFLEGDADATVEIDITDDLRGPTGAVHAGITLLLADVAGSMAIAVRTERVGATASVSVHCLAAAKVGPLRATATMLRASKNTALADVRVVDAGNNDRAIAQFQRTLDLDQSFVYTHWQLGLAYEEKGMYEEAISHHRKAVELSGESTLTLALLTHAYAVSGQKGEAGQSRGPRRPRTRPA